MSKKRRKQLEKAAQSPRPSTHFIDPNVAKQEVLIFGFKHLDLDKGAFACSSGHGECLLYVFKTLRLFSQLIRRQLEMSYPNCHLVPDYQIKQHDLLNLVMLAPNKRLHQLGRSSTPERIVGYFDSPLSNLFQICLLDLNHSLSGN